MFQALRDGTYAGIVTKRTPISVNRRQALRAAGGIGLAAAGLLAFGRGSSAHQEGSPVPMPMPEVGPRADGTTLWKVVVGGMDMENAIELHGFFPGEITINAGDSIWFAEEMPMFHTITFPLAGEVPGLFIPDPEIDPATAQAGPPKLIYNPVMLAGAGGTSVDGTQLVSSAVDVFGDGSPWVFTFPAAGTFDYVCIPHAGVMQARVIVQEAGSALPMDQAAIDAAAAETIAGLYAQGMAEIEKYAAAAQTTRDDGTSMWEIAAGAGGPTQVRVQRFLPGELTITAGDTIKFVNQSEGEPHTVTFLGPDATPPVDPIVETFADGSPKFVQNMESFLPGGGNVWSGSGFLNSGFIGIPQLGLPMEFEVTFDTPGDYIYYCLLHGSPTGEGMAAKLTVQAAG